jgi:hypothetical protein
VIAVVLIFATRESEAASMALSGGDGGSLLEIASKLFPGLTRAERALLEFADVKNVGRGDYAVVVQAITQTIRATIPPTRAGGTRSARSARYFSAGSARTRLRSR